MKYKTRASRKTKLIKKSWWDDGVDEEQELIVPPHDFIVYEPEDTTTGLYDASGVEIHRVKESIGFIKYDDDEEKEEGEE